MSRQRQPKEDILKPSYWAQRQAAANARGVEHHAIYLCTSDEWKAIEERHKTILVRHVKPRESILDAGCGWGRLLELLPVDWFGEYCGVDVSPEFLAEGQRRYGPHTRYRQDRHVFFDQLELPDVGRIPFTGSKFHWGILISIKPMIVRNLGDEYWERCETALKSVCERLLFLEYDVNDEGLVVQC